MIMEMKFWQQPLKDCIIQKPKDVPGTKEANSMGALFFERVNFNLFFSLLQDEAFTSSLTYLINNQTYSNLNVIAHDYSIEVSNSNITILIALFLGFEEIEYKVLENRSNLHVITFAKIMTKMYEEKNIPVKYYDKHDWLLLIKMFSKKKTILGLDIFENLEL
ncbi:hypothetical protein D3C85_1330720 [compost metagenome]